MKLLIWAGFALCALLWTGAAAALSGMLRWSVGQFGSGQAPDLGQVLTAWPIPAWLADWVGVGVLHAVLDGVTWGLQALHSAGPWLGQLLQWLVPLTWLLWAVGLALLLLAAAAGHLLVRRFAPARPAV